MDEEKINQIIKSVREGIRRKADLKCCACDECQEAIRRLKV